MAYLTTHWTNLISLIGMIIEIIGVVLMAARYTNVLRCEIPGVLISALFQGAAAKEAAEVGKTITGDKALVFLQGLSFVALGFALQTVPYIVAIFS